MRTDGGIETEVYIGPYDAVPSLKETLNHEGAVSVVGGLNPDYPHALHLADNDGFGVDFGFRSQFSTREVAELIESQKGNLSRVIITQMVEEVMQ